VKGVRRTNSIQSLHLVVDTDPLNWPAIFDRIIPILSVESSRMYFRGIQRFHQVMDSPSYLVRGFMEPVPSPQGGIPGWTRICFAIYDANRDFLKLASSDGDDENGDDKALSPDEDWPPIDLRMDFHWIFGYEGVMLPGGRMILGQWLDMARADEEQCSRGPFIFWDM
jgi:hypothetical protein